MIRDENASIRPSAVWRWKDGLKGPNADARNMRPSGTVAIDLSQTRPERRAVLVYLDKVDPKTARAARERYGCLTPWQSDPMSYGHAALTGEYSTCEDEVSVVLRELLDKHRRYAEHDGERFLDAVQNARLIANLELILRKPSLSHSRDERRIFSDSGLIRINSPLHYQDILRCAAVRLHAKFSSSRLEGHNDLRDDYGPC